MTTVTIDVIDEPSVPTLGWGWYLAAGIGWFVIGLVILTVQPATIALIALMVGLVLLLAGAFEIVQIFVAPGWKWLHALAGAVFLIAGVLAFMEPFQTFVGLSVLFGWYLIIKGMVVLILSIAMRSPGSLWGLGVAVGIADTIIGLWAIGYPGRSAWLLILWIGIGAIFHGIADVVSAFVVRSDQKAVHA